MDLLKSFLDYVRKESLFGKTDRLLLAVSGGIDSVVLCALCRQAGYNFAIAHCNFNLRGEESDRDENFVAALAQNYGVPFFSKKFETTNYAKANKHSIEEAARELRYNWFNELLSGSGDQCFKYIVTAHHGDDNIETVVMNFFRGTGINGLRGILPKQGKLVRPLLFARRLDLEKFIQDNRLDFMTDHTNAENIYTRNFFRNKIIPLVNKSFPDAADNVLKNTQRFREVEVLYKQAIHLHKKKLIEQKGNEIHIPVLKLLNATPLSTIVHEIIKDFEFTAHQTGEVIALINSESGKYVQSKSHRIIRNRKWLIISPRRSLEAANILIEEGDKNISFSGGSLKIERVGVGGVSLSTDQNNALLDLSCTSFPILLRKWKQGDYFYPLGMQRKKKLSRFFIDKKLSLIQKENVWVLEANKKIIWVIGMRIDDRFKVTDHTKQVLSIRYLSIAGDKIDHALK